MRKYFQALTLWMPLCGFYVVLMASCEKYTDEIPNINGIRIKEYISPSSDNDSFDTLYFYYDDKGLITKGVYSYGTYYLIQYDSLSCPIRLEYFHPANPQVNEFYLYTYDSDSITMIRSRVENQKTVYYLNN